MLQVKFFQVNGNYYVKARHDNNVIDTTSLYNVWEHAAAYIKNVMTWGYTRHEIEFVLDPSLDTDASESIARDIAVYAEGV